MTEHVTGGNPPVPGLNDRDAEVIPLPVKLTARFAGKTFDLEGLAHLEQTEVWPELDTSMTPEQVEEAANNLNIGQVMSGADNNDRPIRLTEWILQQAHVTTDYRGHVARIAERESLKKRIQSTKTPLPVKEDLRAKREKLHELTEYELKKITLGNKVYTELLAAVTDLSTMREEAIAEDEDGSSLAFVKKLSEYESVLEPFIAKSNAIRIYNALYGKLRAPDGKRPSPDLIVSGRILLMFLGRRTLPENDPKSQP
jgi:hypothetical protein